MTLRKEYKRLETAVERVRRRVWGCGWLGATMPQGRSLQGGATPPAAWRRHRGLPFPWHRCGSRRVAGRCHRPCSRRVGTFARKPRSLGRGDPWCPAGRRWKASRSPAAKSRLPHCGGSMTSGCGTWVNFCRAWSPAGGARLKQQGIRAGVDQGAAIASLLPHQMPPQGGSGVGEQVRGHFDPKSR
jgi:hypothetical protein